MKIKKDGNWIEIRFDHGWIFLIPPGRGANWFEIGWTHRRIETFPYFGWHVKLEILMTGFSFTLWPDGGW